MVLLTVALASSEPRFRLLCAAIAAFAVTAHASHIPLAGGMTMLGLGWVAIRRLSTTPAAAVDMGLGYRAAALSVA